jgi:hypothetical protein
MATRSAVRKCVDTLYHAHNRATDDQGKMVPIYDAYAAVLASVGDPELSVATTRLLRLGGQWMPTAPDVCREAREVAAAHKKAEPEVKQQTFHCRDCCDTGMVLIVNRKWLAAHRNEFQEGWFVAGWMREAHVWCRSEREGDLLQTVICGCTCDRSQSLLQRRQAWVDSRSTQDPKPRPPLIVVLDTLHDCRIQTPYCSEDLPPLVLSWANDCFAAA